MAVAPVREHPPGRLASRAVGLSVLAAAVFTAAVATVAIAYGTGHEGAVEDNWLGVLAVVAAAAGLAGALVAFVLALAARIRHERARLLWLPLAVLPALVLFVVLGEAFWWE